MPTAIRLAGFFVFGALAWFTSEIIKPIMPPDTKFGFFSLYNMAIGMVCGWVIMGPRHGNKVSSAIGVGLTAAFITAFWCLLFHSIVEMVTLSFKHVYSGAVEAVIGVFRLMVKFGFMVATPEVIGTIIVGGVLGGALCGKVGSRWP